MHNVNTTWMICPLRLVSFRNAKSPARISVLIAAIWIRGKSKILIHQASLRMNGTSVDAIAASSAIVKNTSNSRSTLDRALNQHSTRPARRKVGGDFARVATVRSKISLVFCSRGVYGAGMARITVEDCLDNVSSRFELVLLASKRARQLLKGAKPLVLSDNRDIVVALREIAAGKVRWAAPKT